MTLPCWEKDPELLGQGRMLSGKGVKQERWEDSEV